VWSGAGASPARLAGRLRRELEGEALPGVGDWVVLAGAPRPGEPAVIDRVLGRRTLFTRGAAGRAARVQVVAANVDLVFVVCGLDEDFNVRRLERYLARVGASGAEPVVILSKADLCADVAARVAEVERRLGGYPSFRPARSAARGSRRCARASRRARRSRWSAPPGPEIDPGERPARRGAAPDRARSCERRSGPHVTTHRQLVLLPGGACCSTPRACASSRWPTRTGSTWPSRT
jgi:ribosome biogenesis GTPase